MQPKKYENRVFSLGRGFLISLLIGVALLGITSGCEEQRVAEIGQPAPDFSLPDVQGQKIAVGDLRGKAVLLNFWATWCDPCKEELPMFQKLLDTYEGSGLAVVLVAVGERPAAVSEYLAPFGFTLITLIDAQQTLGPVYGTNALPKTFLIDSEGVIQSIRFGPFEDFDSLVHEIEPLLPKLDQAASPSASPTPPPTLTKTPVAPTISQTPTASQAARLSLTPTPTGAPTGTPTPTQPPSPTVTRKPLPTFTPTPGPPVFGVSLQASQTALTGLPGELIVFPVTLTNTGNLPDTMDVMILSMVPDGWQGMFCIDHGCFLDGVQALPLQAGESKLIQVKIQSSPEASTGQMGEVVLLVASQGDPDKSASATFKLTIP